MCKSGRAQASTAGRSALINRPSWNTSVRCVAVDSFPLPYINNPFALPPGERLKAEGDENLADAVDANVAAGAADVADD